MYKDDDFSKMLSDNEKNIKKSLDDNNIKIDEAKIKKAMENDMVKSMMKNMNKSDMDKMEALLKNPQALSEMMKSKKAQEAINKIIN